MKQILSAATVAAIGLTCKAYLHSGLCSISVRGLPYLLEALNSSERQNGQGIVTVSNHLSTLDDPLTWGILPARIYFNSHLTRWTLGASDIMFTNPFFSAFFRKGQVIETFRGAGIYQPAIDTAIEKLRAGAWIHLFGEGKVCQSHTYKADPQTGVARLQRFKWGIGRILMETPRPPTIIPMWITGFDNLMPEGRQAPWKFIPRPGVKLSVTFGAPLPPEVLRGAASALGTRSSCTLQGEEVEVGKEKENNQNREVRIVLTEIVQRTVEALGRQVSGDLLTGLPRT
ncbi:acyltransferase-domain-containing protein [Multifurca ochricompacta]|uniref:Tafazzin family protein n=1 Tax=Multifurca ochricompacta TaxID=376703 RepID=A0AAD4M3N0_9AGAM|nr:acyltransferase-domain-containing protein [Multifurca ochricompacta]